MGSSQETGSKVFTELIILAILILGLGVGVLYALYWAGKKSSSSARQKLIDSSNMPKETKLIFFDSPFFLIYFSTSLLYIAFIGFIFFLETLTVSDSGELIVSDPGLITPMLSGSCIDMIPIFLRLFPIVVLIISTLFIGHPLRKVKKIQNDTDYNENTFSYARFFLVIGLCFVLFFSLSWGFDQSVSNPNCGEYAFYTYTVNNVIVHNFGNDQAFVFLIFHPFVPIGNTIQDDLSVRALPLFYETYFWLYGIGLAIIAGKRYGWSGS